MKDFSFAKAFGPLKLIGLFLAAFILTACADAEGQDRAASTDAASASAKALIQPVGNEMKYETASFTVRAGQELTLVFENTATSPAMTHNVVVLSSNDDATANRVGQAALQAGEANEYIPEDDAILAYTPLAKPGETVEVTFTVPEKPGEYRYLCTFPGHYVVMQGTMKVVA